MKNYFAIVGFILSVVSLHAVSPQSVLESISMSVTNNQSEKYLYGVQITESVDEEAWFFQFYDPSYKEDQHWVKAHVGEMVSDRSGALPAFEEAGLAKLLEKDLTMEFKDLKAKAREMAKVADVSPNQFRYVLKHPPGKKTAVWYISLLDSQSKILAQLVLDANSRKTVATSWNEDQSTKTQSTKTAKASTSKSQTSKKQVPKKKQGFGKSVERTFLGIGGDLEEFFTGERTVDKE
ncbi:MAG: hypothetical protein R3F23_05630 [Verrucomicrobiia bacterium]